MAEEMKAGATEKERLQNAAIEFSAAMQGRLFEKADAGKTRWRHAALEVDEHLLESMGTDADEAYYDGIEGLKNDDTVLLDIANKAMFLWWRSKHREELVRA